GFEPPGCCPNCDASQACLLDGRCDCPVIGLQQCGAYGTGCSNTAVKACSFRNATATVRTGIQFANISMGMQFGCPVSTCTRNGLACTSVALPLDGSGGLITGSCLCKQDLLPT